MNDLTDVFIGSRGARELESEPSVVELRDRNGNFLDAFPISRTAEKGVLRLVARVLALEVVDDRLQVTLDR